MDKSDTYEYAGFWSRAGASCIDSILILMISFPILYAIYGSAYINDTVEWYSPFKLIVEWIFPITATIVFWTTRSATPGKMALSLKVLDAETGEPITTGQGFGRYFSYFISAIPLALGFIWVAFDERKQGWHDKIASTVVVRNKAGSVKQVEFSKNR